MARYRKNPYSSVGRNRRMRRMYRRKRRRFVVTPNFARKVRSVIRPELKFLDTGDAGDVDVATSVLVPTINITNSITTGDGASNRQGEKIFPVNLHGIVTYTGNSASSNLDERCRIIIFAWREVPDLPNEPILSQILETPSNPYSAFNLSNRNRFKVFYSRKFTLSNDSTNPQFIKTFKIYIRLRRMGLITYDGATPLRNQIFVYYISTNDTLNEPTFQSYLTFRYNDS